MRAISLLRPLLAGVIPLVVVSAPPARAASAILVPCSESSLVEAVNTANAAGGGDLILAPFCTYTLTGPHSSGGSGQPAGLPNITTPVSLTGLGTDITRAADAQPFRIFEVDGPSQEPGDAGRLTLSAVTVRGGDADLGVGGGIADLGGAVTLVASTVRDNRASFGGGIFTDGALTMAGSVVTTNTATAEGGGIFTGIGGGATLIGSVVAGNTPDDCSSSAPTPPAC